MSLAAIALGAMLATGEKPHATPCETLQAAETRWVGIARGYGRAAEAPPPEWRWRSELGKLQLVRALVAIGRHESRFRRDVQVGEKRGGGAVCLQQLEPVEVRKLGEDPEQLVGVSDEAIDRCLRVGTIMLARMRAQAEARCYGAPHWFGPTVAGYGSGKGCVPAGDWIEGVAARVRTYERTGVRRSLPARMRELLEDS
jgi:hypothetical protein